MAENPRGPIDVTLEIRSGSRNQYEYASVAAGPHAK
jgi:hypothetical protein